MSNKPTSEHDRLTRLESSIAEIMRINYSSSSSIETNELWMDLVEDVAEMLAIGKPRFGLSGFLEACIGGDMMSTI